MTGAPLRGLYINLARSPERRERCDQQLADHGLNDRYQRLEAIDGQAASIDHPDTAFTPGKLGCWLSHLAALKAASEHPGHTHILEDDFQLTARFSPFIATIDQHTAEAGHWDILFTDIDLAGMFNVATMKALVARVDRLSAAGHLVLDDAKPLYAAGNSSYIVNGASAPRVYQLMREGLASNLPNDLWMRKLIREDRLKARVTLPFVTTVNDGFNDSTILGNIGSSNPSILFATLFRRALAADADTGALLATFKQHLGRMPPINDRGMIYAHLVAHFMSDDFKTY